MEKSNVENVTISTTDLTSIIKTLVANVQRGDQSTAQVEQAIAQAVQAVKGSQQDRNTYYENLSHDIGTTEAQRRMTVVDNNNWALNNKIIADQVISKTADNNNHSANLRTYETFDKSIDSFAMGIAKLRTVGLPIDQAVAKVEEMKADK